MILGDNHVSWLSVHEAHDGVLLFQFRNWMLPLTSDTQASVSFWSGVRNGRKLLLNIGVDLKEFSGRNMNHKVHGLLRASLKHVWRVKAMVRKRLQMDRCFLLNLPQSWAHMVQQTEQLSRIMKSHAEELNSGPLHRLTLMIKDKQQVKKSYQSVHQQIEAEMTKVRFSVCWAQTECHVFPTQSKHRQLGKMESLSWL